MKLLRETLLAQALVAAIAAAVPVAGQTRLQGSDDGQRLASSPLAQLSVESFGMQQFSSGSTASPQAEVPAVTTPQFVQASPTSMQAAATHGGSQLNGVPVAPEPFHSTQGSPRSSAAQPGVLDQSSVEALLAENDKLLALYGAEFAPQPVAQATAVAGQSTHVLGKQSVMARPLVVAYAMRAPATIHDAVVYQPGLRYKTHVAAATATGQIVAGQISQMLSTPTAIPKTIMSEALAAAASPRQVEATSVATLGGERQTQNAAVRNFKTSPLPRPPDQTGPTHTPVATHRGKDARVLSQQLVARAPSSEFPRSEKTSAQASELVRPVRNFAHSPGQAWANPAAKPAQTQQHVPLIPGGTIAENPQIPGAMIAQDAQLRRRGRKRPNSVQAVGDTMQGSRPKTPVRLTAGSATPSKRVLGLAARVPGLGQFGADQQSGSGIGANQGFATAKLQAQYNVELAQYLQQQRQFEDWTRRYQEYQQAYAQQRSQYELYQRGLQQQQPPQPQPQPEQPQQSLPQVLGRLSLKSHPDRQFSTFVQSGVAGNGAQESAVVEQKRKLVREEQMVQLQYTALQHQAEQLHAEELADQQRERLLAAKESAFQEKERQLKVVQSELVQEQRKLWRVLQTRSSPSLRRMPLSPPQATPQRPPLALTQLASGSRARRASGSGIVHSEITASRGAAVDGGRRIGSTALASRVHAALTSNSRAGHRTSTQVDGSDLHLVVAAQAPRAVAASSSVAKHVADEDREDSMAGSAADEDSSWVRNEDQQGQYADNDDLEQILLQRSTSARRSSLGDALELA